MSIFEGFWDGFEKVLTPIHPEGFKFAAIAAALMVLCLFFWQFGACLFALLTAFILYFFRDPVRVVPMDKNLIVAPADGKISAIDEITPPKDYQLGNEPLYRISIFLSVFDVHIQRAPIAGVVDRVDYHKGLFLNASLDKASEDNERNVVLLTGLNDQKIAVVQIAGLIARRILCFVKPGDDVGAGERYGLIRFGSRVDLYLPKGAVPLVAVGQRTLGGETVLADLALKGIEREARAV